MKFETLKMKTVLLPSGMFMATMAFPHAVSKQYDTLWNCVELEVIPRIKNIGRNGCILQRDSSRIVTMESNSQLTFQ